MSLISVIWKLFKSLGQWDQFDVGCMLGKGDQLFKYIDKCRYLGIEEVKRSRLGKLQQGYIYCRNSANWNWCSTYC